MLSHPNIIRMKGISQSDPQKARFFVILDRLSMTLDRKFNQWRRIVGESTGYWVPCYGYCCSNSAILHELWIERLSAARDIATALAFLHLKHIIYRDMKPDNVGFDINGELKVFDFGLAKKLDGGGIEQCGENYLLTGNTGSLRYMAPEVAQDKPYNTAVDVYSFAVLFWQICSLTTPYSGYSQAKHNLDVVFKGHRPRCDPSWPKEWKSVMQAGWNHVPSARPGMQEMVQNLTRILADDHLPAEVRIRAKIRRASVKSPVLDVDTRTEVAVASQEASASAVTKRYNANIV
jgi:serine/threonine protein kinase